MRLVSSSNCFQDRGKFCKAYKKHFFNFVASKDSPPEVVAEMC